MALISVIIPTFNRVDVLGRAIRSVIVQSCNDLEIVVVDDGSEDDTLECVERFIDPRIIYLKHERNQGQCAAINTGIEASRGEYVAFLDSDDEWLPTILEKQVSIFQKHDDRLGLVFVFAELRREDGSTGVPFTSRLRGRVYREALEQGYLAPSITLLVRKSCFDRTGLFDTRFSCFQDDDICFRIAREFDVDFVPEILAIMHQGASLQLTKDRLSFAQGWEDLVKKYESEIERECGNRVLAAHYMRSGELFLNAGEPGQARRSFSRAEKITGMGMARLYGALARWVPFTWPLARGLKRRLKRLSPSSSVKRSLPERADMTDLS